MKSSWRGPNYTTEMESNKGAPRVRTAPRGEAIPLGAPLPQRDKKIPGAAVLDTAYIPPQLARDNGRWADRRMEILPKSDKNTEIRSYFCKMAQLFIDIKTKKLDNICMDFLSKGVWV